MFENLRLEPLALKHENAVIDFCDQFIGKNYFNKLNFKEQVHLSIKGKLNSSFVLFDNNKLISIRISYVPGSWLTKINSEYLGQLDTDLEKVAYFKSLFVHKDYQRLKIGPKLSHQSIDVLKKLECEYILAHAWLESPNNSSVRYLEKYGFKSLGPIQKFWKDVDYLCRGCNQQPCICTAMEMLLKL